jgi:hypothetical protein
LLRAPESELVQVGQRFQAYTVNSRTRMHLGFITKITPQAGGALVEGTLPIQAANDASRYLMEIVVERGPYLSVPNVSIIEEGAEHVVYCRSSRANTRRRSSRRVCKASCIRKSRRAKGRRSDRLGRQLFRRRRNQAQIGRCHDGRDARYGSSAMAANVPAAETR